MMALWRTAMPYPIMKAQSVGRVTDYRFAAKPKPPASHHFSNAMVDCDWPVLRAQLLQQWNRLTPYELEATKHDRRRIAELIQRKYGIPMHMAENYLLNFERTLPLVGRA